jgi:hypothetical protein
VATSEHQHQQLIDDEDVDLEEYWVSKDSADKSLIET